MRVPRGPVLGAWDLSRQWGTRRELGGLKGLMAGWVGNVLLEALLLSPGLVTSGGWSLLILRRRRRNGSVFWSQVCRHQRPDEMRLARDAVRWLRLSAGLCVGLRRAGGIM